MKNVALYRALIEAGASEESATRAAEDVIHEAQQSQPATKVDLGKTGIPAYQMDGRFFVGFLPASSLR